MTLLELKKSLSRFPPDMDDTEVLIQYGNDKGELDADCLAFVACASFKERASAAIILGSWKCADIMQKESPEKFPANYKYRPEIKPSKHQNTDTQNEES